MPSSTIAAWLFPGQGSQSLGMGREIWSQPGRALEIVKEAEDLTSFPLRAISLQGPAEELTRTDVLQPAITAVALGCVEILKDAGLKPQMVAGHSLGEFTALCASGVFGATDCLRLVTDRGRLMQYSAQRLNGGMGAVKRLSPAVLGHLIASKVPAACIANWNSPDQIAVSGPNDSLLTLASEVAAAGGEFVTLPVAGPWHHPSMEDAAEEFRQVVQEIDFHAPNVPVYMNVSGKAESDPVRIKNLVKVQMTSPVLWQASIEGMFAAGARLFLEVGPGKVLRGLMRKIVADESSYRVRGIENQRSLQFLAKEGLIPC